MTPTAPQWTRLFARGASFLVLLTGVLVLSGWALNLNIFKSVPPGFPPMAPNTALSFVVCGISLWLLLAEPLGTWRRRSAQFSGLVVASMGALSLGEYLFGWNLGMDQMLVPNAAAALASPVASRPSLLTGFNFCWFGLALVAAGRKSSSGQWLADLLVVVPMLVALLALIGYACNVPSFYGWRSLFPDGAMALHTTMTFLPLGAALLCVRPERGLMKVLIGVTAGSVVARRLLLAPVLIPLVTGLLRIGGQQAGLYNAEFANWFFAYLNIFVFTLVIWWIATLLHKAELVRQRAESEVRLLNVELERRVTQRTAELQQARELLHQEKERLRLIIDTALDGVITIGSDGIVTGWSRQAESIFGWSANDVLGRRLSEMIIPSRYRQAHERGLRRFVETRQGAMLNRRIEISALHRDGHEFPVELAITPFQLGSGVTFSAFVRDITERKHAEEALARERNLLRTVIDNLPVYIYLKDTQGRFVVNNLANVQALKRSSETETLGKTVFDFFPPDIAQLYDADDRQVLSRGEPMVERELPLRHMDGREGWILTTKLPLRDSDGTITGLLGISLNITERKAAAEALDRERHFLRLLVGNLPACIYVKDAEGRFLLFNAASVRLVGLGSEAEALGKTVFDFFPPEIARLYEEDDRRVLAANEPIVDREEPTQDRDGQRRWFLTTKLPLRDGRGGMIGLLGISQDITERKRAEEKLRHQLSRMDLLHRITRAIGERQDLPSIFQVVIRRLEEDMPIEFGCVCLYDASLKTLTVASVGVRSHALALELAMTEQARIEIDQNGLSRCVQGRLVCEPDVDRVPFPFPQRLARGGLRSMVAAPLLVESQVFGVLIAGRREANSFSSDDCEFLRQLSEHVALAAHQAQLHGALQKAYDDLRRTQQLVMQQERLRALGEMASGIAHDINNAISPVALYTESLLEKEPGLSTRTREYLETIQRAIEDVAATVARMREFYRQREPQLALAPVRVNELIQQVIDLTSARWSDMPQQRGTLIQMCLDLAEELTAIMGVESEIREALTNLVFNAVDAMPDGGTLTVRTRLDAGADGQSEAAQCVVVEVTDTGIGMNEETRRRCLEPFFTTKGERGTGLGLAMVYGIVRRHGAAIEIESAPGNGTTMRLKFPVPREASARTVRAESEHAVPSRLRILAVDDDPLLLQSLRDTLENDGHVVTIANGGQAGIDTFRSAQEKNEPFHIVITDLGMPHVDGRKVATVIKVASPGTPVILLTGWGQRLVAEGDVPPHVDRVLNKPPKLADLRETFAQYCRQQLP